MLIVILAVQSQIFDVTDQSSVLQTQPVGNVSSFFFRRLFLGPHSNSSFSRQQARKKWVRERRFLLSVSCNSTVVLFVKEADVVQAPVCV